MLRKNGKMELLRAVDLFRGCTKSELGEIAQIADEVVIPAGTALITQGEPGRQFLVLVDGDVDVVRDGQQLPDRGETEAYGEISLLTGLPATASVTATTDVRALVIEPRAFRHLLDASPTIQLRLLRSVSERLAPQLT
ncbi:MAG TPA: cyclic nucleotide-binding domain-containing protein [Gaiellales bacterium]